MIAAAAILSTAAALGAVRFVLFLRATRAGAFDDPVGSTLATWLSRGRRC
ncbi:MAG: hypothetical protein WCY15_07555 [Phenylobacterium sp.]|nr:hypothetical protein [Phenylobacterium sp.]MDX9997412.1 hypothetical protein [Phenylobacterium sp.]